MTGPLAVGLSARQSLTAVMADLHQHQFAALGADVVDFVGGAGALAADPVAAEAKLVDAGLSFLISLIEPLQRCLDEVTGDAHALEARAADWSRLAGRLRDSVPPVEDLARAARENWHGQAAEAFCTTMAEFVETVAGAAAACDGVTLLLRMSAELMTGAQGLIVDLIRRVVEYMIAAEAAAAASAVLTMGASEAAALSSIIGRVAEGVEKAIEIVDRVAALLERIAQALRELSAVFGRVEQLLVQLGRLAGAARAAAGPLGVKLAGTAADAAVALGRDVAVAGEPAADGGDTGDSGDSGDTGDTGREPAP